MTNMRRIRKPIIKLGKVRRGSGFIPRVGADSRRLLNSFSPRSQRVVVKVKQSYNNSLGSWQAHGRYLERDSARFGDGFSKNDDSVAVAKVLHNWQQQGDEKLHKIILSPEYSERLDLREETRNLMAEMERDLKRSIEWTAILHKNTENPHVHVSLRGVDGEGKSLDVEGYLGKSLRERFQEQVTNRIGPRLYPEIFERREKERFSKSLTDIDRALLWKADADFVINIPQYKKSDWQRSKAREQERIRLGFLAELGLAEKISQTSWKLSPELRDALRQLGLREQLIREQVPGWEFVRALRRGGVVRKRLQVGESLTGRVVGVGIRDPFGDRRFMLLEGSDGTTYHINQARGVDEHNISQNQVVTLTRRVATIRTGNEGKLTEREFTAVDAHRDWRRSLALDYEAANNLRLSEKKERDSRRVGFSKEWHEEVKKRVASLRAKNFNPHSANWREELETIRFREADANAVEWKPGLLVGKQSNDRKLDRSRLLVGEVLATGEKSVLLQDLRQAQGTILRLSDVGLEWPPSVGTMVRVEAKRIPHVKIRRSDGRIASILSRYEMLDDDKLSEDEKKFVLSRSRTWAKWKILQEREDGGYELTDKEPVPSRREILQRMEVALKEVRETISEKVRKQPAWLKIVDEKKLSAEANRFGLLDTLLRDLGPVAEDARVNWLTNKLRERQKLWKSRGVEINESFEKKARAWLGSDESRDVIAEIFPSRERDRGSKDLSEP